MVTIEVNSMRLRAVILVLLFGLGSSFSAFSQDGKPGEKEEVIRVDTQLVDVPVAVVTAAGRPVRGLKASNFVVTEDGKRQEITEFSTTSEPFEVALLLDTSGSTRADLRLIQSAAQYFIASLRPGDRVAIVAYDTETRDDRPFAINDLASPLTSDRRLLRTAIDNIRTSNGTPYYDSLLQVVTEVFRDAPKEEFRGRRALVAFTDGVDSTSSADFSAAKELLDEAGIISFFIQVETRDFFEEGLLGNCQLATKFSSAQIRRYYRSIGAKGNVEKAASFCDLGEFERLAISKRLYEIADTEMNDMAKRSGGKVFPVNDLTEARDAFKGVAEEIGTKYSIGYYSTNEKRDGTHRKIKVEIKGLPPGAKVRTREGYTAPLE
ncbi:MAG: VWA domain-containing protein [Pyrinomonadaceae bacterium]